MTMIVTRLADSNVDEQDSGDGAAAAAAGVPSRVTSIGEVEFVPRRGGVLDRYDSRTSVRYAVERRSDRMT